MEERNTVVSPKGAETEATAFIGGDVPRVAVNEVQRPVFETLEIPGATSLPVVALPNGYCLQSMQSQVEAAEKMQSRPYRRRGLYLAADVRSLLNWMGAHAPEDAPVFASGLDKLNGEWREPALSLTGIANYSHGSEPSWHDFSVRYEFPVSLAWKTWAAHHSPNQRGDGVWFKQEEFAEFVEDHIHEIDEMKSGDVASEAVTRFIEASGKEDYATPAELFRMSRDLKIFATSKCEVKFDPQTGESRVQYSEEHTGPAGRPLKLPSLFFIRIPVFFGQSPVLIGVKLRYRNAGQGVVAFSYSLFAPDLVVAAEFERAIAQIRKEGRTVYLGTHDVQK